MGQEKQFLKKALEALKVVSEAIENYTLTDEQKIEVYEEYKEVILDDIDTKINKVRRMIGDVE